MGSSVRRTCFDMVRDDLSVALVGLESEDRTNLSKTVGSSYLAWGYLRLHVIVICVVGAGWNHCSLFHLFVIYCWGVSSFCFRFAPSFHFCTFVGPVLCPLGFDGVGGYCCWQRVIPSGPRLQGLH